QTPTRCATACTLACRSAPSTSRCDVPRLRRLSGRDARAILERHGFVLVRQKGSHMILQRIRPEGGTITVPIPDHRELKTGTLLAISAQTPPPRALFEAHDAPPPPLPRPRRTHRLHPPQERVRKLDRQRTRHTRHLARRKRPQERDQRVERRR